MKSQDDDGSLAPALQPLLALKPDESVALPPRRLSLGGGRECLIQWEFGRSPAHRLLRLTDRPAGLEGDAGPIPVFQAELDLASKALTIEWQNANPAFADWVGNHLPSIASDIAAVQPEAKATLAERAGVGSKSGTSLTDFVPHFVIIVALAAFAYMFAQVHIKP